MYVAKWMKFELNSTGDFKKLIKNPNRSRAAGYSFSWDFLILLGIEYCSRTTGYHTQARNETRKNSKMLKSFFLAIFIGITWFGEKYFNLVSSWSFPFNLIAMIVIVFFLALVIYFCLGDLLDHA